MHKGLIILVLSSFMLPSIYGQVNSEYPTGEMVRLIVGAEQAAVSSGPRKQNFFSNFYISVPIGNRNIGESKLGQTVRLWGDIRITSIPEQIKVPVREFVTGFADKLGQVRVNELAQSAELLVGAEYRIWEMENFVLGFDKKCQQKISANIILSAGLSTPLNPRESMQVFYNDENQTMVPDFEYIAYVSPDRDRFYRQYYLGIRLKTHYFDLNGKAQTRFPAMFDFAFGQNEAITGGRLRGVVFKVDGFYPLPWEDLKSVFLYGSAQFRLKKPEISDPLILQAVPENPPIQIPGPEVSIVTAPQFNKDHYRIGAGIDLISLLGEWF